MTRGRKYTMDEGLGQIMPLEKIIDGTGKARFYSGQSLGKLYVAKDLLELSKKYLDGKEKKRFYEGS